MNLYKKTTHAIAQCLAQQSKNSDQISQEGKGWSSTAFPELSSLLKAATSGLLPLALLAISTASAEAQTQLRFATGQAPESIIQERQLGPWMNSVNEASNGLLEITAFPPPFAESTNMWDRVTSGVADIGYVSMPNTGLNMSASSVAALPTLGEDTEAAAVAFWRLYERGLLEEGLDEVKVLGFNGVIPLRLYSPSPITELKQLEGLRVRTPDRITANALTLLGASPTSIPFNEAYQALSRGVVDASLGNGHSMVVYRFREVLNHQVADISFGITPYLLIMNRDAYDQLGDEERAVLDKWVGERTSRMLGAAENELSVDYNKDLISSGDLTVHHLPEEELGRWNEAMTPVIEDWIADAPGNQVVLDAYLEEYESVASGN